RFEPLQSWYFRDVGDSFAEFKAGGIAVVCGVNPRNGDNILGYRPCVGMVGGTIYFRGPIQGYSESDVQCVDLTPQDWEWLTGNIKPYLKAIRRQEHYQELTRSPEDWKKLIAYTPVEKKERQTITLAMPDFRIETWERGVGSGGIFGEYIDHEQTILPYITTGDHRRFKPVWKNDVYLPPCAYACPSRIPSHKRASLIRQNKLEEALTLVLKYSPFPASVCGQVCPNLCMDACTRGQLDSPLDIKNLGKMSLEIPPPKKARSTGRRVAVIGAGPAGLSTAWQLGLRGHSVDLHEASNHLGGKLDMCIPRDRLPQKVLKKEISRFEEIGVSIHLNKRVTRQAFGKIYKDHEIVVVSCGAHEARMIKFKGDTDVIPGIEFLKEVNYGKPPNLKGKKVVVIGAGNAGMDIACQAYACGAKTVYAVDIQPPASFGKERELAESRGTKILYPKVTERYDHKNRKIHFQDGTSLDADMVIMSIGEVPVLDFLPQNIHTERGYIAVNKLGQTSDLKVFAVGDATQPGLVTHAIGQGRVAADVIHSQMMNYDYVPEIERVIPYERIRTAYYDAERQDDFVPEVEANKCMSCGSCRDCGMCETACYYNAISRTEENGSFEYVVNEKLCIGCGFCAGICPCGVWEMTENL
ncbi:MAG: FAD-dependent oxidoreductase, partial [bacterium]|nr:FAD-dependent oxidoreductase [bacterium]